MSKFNIGGRPTPLSLGAASILHAVASGSRFGFDVMDATGLTSGTVYPALDRLESLGLLESRWEDGEVARRQKRPPRRYFSLTAQGGVVLAEVLERYKALRPVGRRAVVAIPGRV
jgi:DNA-binding PadR family transcriptional regulator